MINSNSEDCQLWIDAINYAAASLSAPPLPGACGSQKKFQRPLMPSSYTRLSLVCLLIIDIEHRTIKLYFYGIERHLQTTSSFPKREDLNFEAKYVY
jgi:hypothetical protein